MTNEAAPDPNARAAQVETLGALETLFDSVIMLTQSDWRTEPRSNRYHYATRFAARLPTYFVQPDAPHTAITEEAGGIDGLTLVHGAWWDEEADAARAHDPRFRQVTGERDPNLRPTPAQALKAYFDGKNVRRPLIWIYNPNYVEFLDAWPVAFKVFHATEDYTLDAASGRYFDDAYQNLVYRVLGNCDLLVAVSEPVRSHYRQRSGYSGPSVTLPNGCDFAFWSATEAYDYQPPAPAKRLGLLGRLAHWRPRPLVFYQGGVNDRLDFAMIEALAGRMADVDFVFSGPVATGGAESEASVAWARCLRRPNVVATGMATLDGVAAMARRAIVGIIPYRPTPLIAVSLPLKAYEYLACGLPVVTTPIPALEAEPDLFRFAESAADYEAAIRVLAPTRTDPGAVERRLAAAQGMDYGLRFAELEAAIAREEPGRRRARGEEPSSPREFIARWGPDAVDCHDAWREAGAGLVVADGVANITAPRDAWNFAATVRIELENHRQASETSVLEVTVRGVRGDLTVSLFEDANSRILCETPLANVEGVAVYRLTMQPTRSCLLLFRNGARGSGGSLAFLNATLSV